MARKAKSAKYRVKDEAPSTPDETLDDLLNKKRQRRRTKTPIRRGFLQDPDGEGAARPLQWFVRERRPLALDLFLLLHCTASAPPWDVQMAAMAWARALDMPLTASSESTVSKNWTWLEGKQLIGSERENRVRKVFLRNDEGTGEDYVRPSGGGRGFFSVPFVYFTGRWHKGCGLPGKAVLLIALAQRQQFTLVTERAAEWYGVSQDTLQRGLDELRDHGLLTSWLVGRKSGRTRDGLTRVSHHHLNPPFER